MKRSPLTLGLLTLALSCSKPSSEAVPNASPPLSASGLGAALSSAEIAAGRDPISTPEDVEAETEHRITEQNLESELDRLEREIQAE